MPFQPPPFLIPLPSPFNPNSRKVELFATLPSNFHLFDNGLYTIKRERKKQRLQISRCNFKTSFFDSTFLILMLG